METRKETDTQKVLRLLAEGPSSAIDKEEITDSSILNLTQEWTRIGEPKFDDLINALTLIEAIRKLEGITYKSKDERSIAINETEKHILRRTVVILQDELIWGRPGASHGWAVVFSDIFRHNRNKIKKICKNTGVSHDQALKVLTKRLI